MATDEWFHIMAIKVSIVVRADNASADAGGTGAIQMFGSLYNGPDGTFTPTQDTQAARRLFTTTLRSATTTSVFRETRHASDLQDALRMPLAKRAGRCPDHRRDHASRDHTAGHFRRAHRT